MNRLPVRTATIAAMCLWAGIAFEARAECSATGCYAVYVHHLAMTASNGFWVQTTGTETLANCTPDSGVFFFVPAGTAQLKELYATLLMAQQTEKLVDIVIVESTNPCTVSYVNLYRQ